MKFDPVYHWAPRVRHEDIVREGLKPFSHPVMHGPAEDGRPLKFPYICLGTTPSVAWGLSGGTVAEDEFREGWDLWMVRLPEEADVHVLPFWGAYPQELRVKTALPASCCWYVGTRQSKGVVPVGEAQRTRESVMRAALVRISRQRVRQLGGQSTGDALRETVAKTRERARQALREIDTMVE